jgi:hypothetical protein
VPAPQPSTSTDCQPAGVVPPLGACAMASRRTSSDRPRGWSQESGSSQDEDILLFNGTRALTMPGRQPSGPPADNWAQKDVGFAKFLKKHSSPTHQRVTAGGRIVPMEQQPRLPACALPNSNKHSPEMKNTQDLADGLPVSKPGTSACIHNQGAVTEFSLPQQPEQLSLGSIGIPDASTFSPGQDIDVVVPATPPVFDTARMQPGYLQAISSPPFFNGIVSHPSTMMIPAPVFQGVGVPFVGFNGYVNPPVTMPFVNPQMLTPLPSAGITSNPSGILPEDTAHAEGQLNEATALFQTLDEQLKELDRHRAMTERDPYLSDQRMAIVLRRAEAKEQITHWAEKLGRDPQSLPKVVPTAPRSRLNVQATSYVPLRAQQTTEASSNAGVSILTTNYAGKGPSKPDFVVETTRRPIPIVPPPGKIPSPPKSTREEAVSKTEEVAVDEWGVRIGAAPLDILLQQNQMLENIMRQGSISPTASGPPNGKYSRAASQDSRFGVHTPPFHPPQLVKNTSDVGSDVSEWLPPNPGPVPESVQACYELELDAMRLPTGLITKVRLPDGTITEIRGCSLKRPPSIEMDEDDFQRRYWNTKPILTPDIFDNFVEIRSAAGEKEAGSIAAFLEIQAMARERFVFPCASHELCADSRLAVSRRRSSSRMLSRVTNPPFPAAIVMIL